jgi:hypothetical protein
LEKAAYAALPPASQQMVCALAEDVEAPVVALVGRRVMLAEAIVLVPILGLSAAAAVLATLDGWVSPPGTSDGAYIGRVNHAVVKSLALLFRTSEFTLESLEAHLCSDLSLASKDRPEVFAGFQGQGNARPQPQPSPTSSRPRTTRR